MTEEVASTQSLPPGARRFGHDAMATSFEAVLFCDDPRYAEQCVHEAFQEVDRIELLLSSYIENSDISRINHAEVGAAVRVGLDTFACLEHCIQLSSQTLGAFDVTIGALIDCWARAEASGQIPQPERLTAIQEGTGAHLLELDRDGPTVTKRSELVSVDLGGYGKGYAVDRMAEVLEEWGIRSALLHGGASSVLALDPPPGESGWPVTLRRPSDRNRVVGRFRLRHQAMGASGLRRGNHIIDPRSGRPSTDNRAAWAVATDAATGDALSTAFMVLSPAETRTVQEAHPESLAITIRVQPGGSEQLLRFGDFADLERDG